MITNTVNLKIHMKSGAVFECLHETKHTNTHDIIKEVHGPQQHSIYELNWAAFSRKDDPGIGRLYILTNDIEAVEIW